ncbi:PfkB family carbohydrate kinase [Streptomyces tauricus]|uniref:PfkB family carbohydrate kinase n=1 Tax=Streptomyces tauricus TaxID=68274 RepID=UPI00342FA50A
MPHTFDFDLLAIGDANPDVVLGPLDAPLAFGQHEQLVDSGLLPLGGSAAVSSSTAATAPVSVGAGGGFDAGFVAARLRGLSTADALALASACGALSTRAHGGTPSQPTWDEAVAALSRNGKNL